MVVSPSTQEAETGDSMGFIGTPCQKKKKREREETK
jgi:hypothetical protein